MRWFDCNCSYGIGARPPLRYARSAGELLAEMDWCGIDRALVYHTNMRFDSPVAWNPRLASDIHAQPRLIGSWAILPSQTGEQAEPAEFLRLMKQHDVKTLIAFPDEHRYRLDARTFGPLLESLIAARIPLFIKQNILAIGDLLEDFPELPVVAMNIGPHSLERYLRPLLDAFPALHVETSHYMVEGLIEEFCERYGHARLLFGSGYPDVCSGASRLRLAQADIPDEARAAIAGGNLERLLGEVRL